MRTTAILPAGTTMNPLNPEGAEYYDVDQVAFVMQQVGAAKPTRVFTSFGDLSSWTVGSTHACHHDQTGRFLGNFTVVGKITFKTRAIEGHVPDRKLQHGVFK